jgi:hypothetical protein
MRSTLHNLTQIAKNRPSSARQPAPRAIWPIRGQLTDSKDIPGSFVNFFPVRQCTTRTTTYKHAQLSEFAKQSNSVPPRALASPKFARPSPSRAAKCYVVLRKPKYRAFRPPFNPLAGPLGKIDANSQTPMTRRVRLSTFFPATNAQTRTTTHKHAQLSEIAKQTQIRPTPCHRVSVSPRLPIPSSRAFTPGHSSSIMLK